MKAKIVHERNALRLYAQKLYKIFDQIYREGNGDIRCPSCGEETLNVSYTRNENDNYGIWIECPACHLLEHVDVKGQPAGFKEGLIRLEYQRLDDHAWQAGNWT